jgi:hypothetical protein
MFQQAGLRDLVAKGGNLFMQSCETGLLQGASGLSYGPDIVTMMAAAAPDQTVQGPSISTNQSPTAVVDATGSHFDPGYFANAGNVGTVKPGAQY